MQRGPQRLLGSLPGHSGWRSRKSLALWCSRWSIPNLQTLLQTSGRSLPRSNLRKSLRSLPLHVTRIRYDMHIYFPPSSLFSIGPPKHVIMLFFLGLTSVSTNSLHLSPLKVPSSMNWWVRFPMCKSTWRKSSLAATLRQNQKPMLMQKISSSQMLYW